MLELSHGKSRLRNLECSTDVGQRNVACRPRSATGPQQHNSATSVAHQQESEPEQPKCTSQSVHEGQAGPCASDVLREDHQAEIQQTPQCTQSSGTSTQTPSTQLDIPILITETMLDQVNAVSAIVLDRYEADARDSGAQGNAEAFYDQLMTARRDYWYGQLVETARSPWATPL